MTPTDSSYPIRDAFRRFFPNYAELHPFLPMEQLKVASSIMRCKTGELGYNVSYCDDCGYPLVHAVSCNNRSCPCCQAPLEKKWELERNTGKEYKQLYIVGGGAKNQFLNRLTEEVTGKRVIILPIEATALGNLKIQMEAIA